MNMTDKVLVRRRQAAESDVFALTDVHVTVTAGITPERGGYGASGQICLRVPCEKWCDLHPGDRIKPEGDDLWYAVSEVRKNVVPDSRLSHYKVIGRR